MVQCEMCGTDTASPKTVKVEGAELQVCSSCADFGTEVSTDDSGSSTSTKYSTGSSESSSGSSSGGSAGGSTSSGGSRRGSDMFDDVDDLARDYGDRIRRAREEEGLTQAGLADELNEKASLIRKLERDDTLPSDAVQSKLERRLGISLSAGADDEDAEWESDAATGEYTLGDVVKRKD